MSVLENKLEVIEPTVFNRTEGIVACFTLKNPSVTSDNRVISGLDLGSNTVEKDEVVQENRNELLKTLDIDPNWLAYGNQVHGNRVQVITRGGSYSETDGFVTQVPRLALAIQVADCAAVLLGDSVNRVVAAVHAGWRGVTGDIVPKSIKYMIAQGAQPDHIRAFVSPCISLQHFEVGPEVAKLFPDKFVDYESYEKPHVDLKGYIKHQLLTKGLKPEHIEAHSDCTVRDNDRYFSYRREGDESGRMMGIIQMLKRDEL